ncbi:helix-turn-helix domain-containing protein [Aliihoeflea sp. PC F10.4]
MSWQATAWVSTIEAGGASGKLLLYALANYADENGRTFAGDGRIMRDTELSERAVRDWKRKLADAGLISISRRRKPGGDFDIDVIMLAMDRRPPADSAGGESDATTGKSCRDHRQMTPSPPANGAVPPTPPYKAEPSKEPSEEPIERGARGSEREDDLPASETPGRADFEKRVQRFCNGKGYQAGPWPGWEKPSFSWIVSQFAKLTVDERAEAERWRDPYLLVSGGKANFVGPFLRDKAWERFDDAFKAKAEAAAARPAGEIASAGPWGPTWAMKCHRALLLDAPQPSPAPSSAYLRQLVQQDDEQGRAERLRRQADYGWPQVRAWHAAASDRKSIAATIDDKAFDHLMEPVKPTDPLFDAWKRFYAAQGWPWIPDPGSMPVVYFPAGGPDNLHEFEHALRGNEGSGDDGDRAQAAE